MTRCRLFFRWYDTEHYHAELCVLSPEGVHYSFAAQVVEDQERIVEAPSIARLAGEAHNGSEA